MRSNDVCALLIFLTSYHYPGYIVQLDTGSSDLWIMGNSFPLSNVSGTVSFSAMKDPRTVGLTLFVLCAGDAAQSDCEFS